MVSWQSWRRDAGGGILRGCWQERYFAIYLAYPRMRRMPVLVSASCFTPTKTQSDTAQQGSRTQHQTSLLRGDHGH
jgi:hypothetical protein